jgi:adenosylcobinamide-GDP ribazoletransferase
LSARTDARPADRVRLWEGPPLALAFLTRIPVRLPEHEHFDLGPALAWFAVVGAGIGALAGALRLVTTGLLGTGPSTVIAMIALVAVTGALHQDALADTADGLGVRGDRARRLAVMRDSSVGAFGVCALVLWALLLYAAVAPLTESHGLIALTCAGASGRAAAVAHGWAAPPARRDGLGAGLGATWPRALAALVLAAAITVAVAGPARGALCCAVMVGAATLTAVAARRGLGGSTGDTLGATVAIGEVAVCLALLATWR